MISRSISLAVSYVAGIVLAMACRVDLPAAATLVPALLGAVFSGWILYDERRWRVRPRLLIVLAAALLGFPLGHWRAMQRLGPPAEGSLAGALEEVAPGSRIGIRGSVCREPELRDDRNSDIVVRVDEIRTTGLEWTAVKPGRVMCRVYTDGMSPPEEREAFRRLSDPRAYGYRVEGAATFRPPSPPLHPGEFDFGQFIEQSGWTARLRMPAERMLVLEPSRGNPAMELALWAKRRFIATYRVTIRNPASRLVAAATLGTRRAVEKVSYRDLDITQSFRHAGVGHVLAVSGLHVSVITVLLYQLFRLTGMRPRVFAPILIVCLILFALLTGARPSSVRAVVMNSVILAAFAYFHFGFRQATSVGLAVSALGILLVNPLILFSPSFMLSYGAVLSLVLISPPLDRWVCLLRGFSLLFFFAWIAAVIAVICVWTHVFFSLANCVAAFGVLWLLVKLGTKLNHACPVAWRLGLERVPTFVRLLVSAQIAIQVGMMVPLSAWFFGQFPVVGVIVNLVAIPAIGVLVQLGIIVGLLGLVPGVGHYLALPFGVTDSLVGEFFFRIAHAGATTFPFPAVPKPTIGWMVAYFLVLGVILSSESWIIFIRSWVYRHGAQGRGATIRRIVAWVTPFVLIALPFVARGRVDQRCHTVTCFATRNYPVVSFAFSDARAMVVNAGRALDGERLLFQVLRKQGATSIDAALLTGPQPEAGNDGLAALARKMKVAACYAPFAPKDPAQYLAAIGDAYLMDEERRLLPWVQRYTDSYEELQATLTEEGTTLTEASGPLVVEQGDTRLAFLPPPSELPSRFVSRAVTRVVHADALGLEWIIVSDSTPGVLAEVLSKQDGCDVLVLPDHAARKGVYTRLINDAVRLTRPRVVIISGSRVSKSFDVDAWAAGLEGCTVFSTARDGAVLATRTEDGDVHLRGHLGGKALILAGGR